MTMRAGNRGGYAVLAIVGIAGGAPAFAGTLGGAEDGISLWRVLGALLLCLVLAVAGAFALKIRYHGVSWTGSRDSQRRLRLVERIRLNQQVEFCIVACDGLELLISASAQGAEVIHRLPSVVSNGDAQPPCP